MLKPVLLIALLLETSVAFAQIRWAELQPVSANDPATPALQEWQGRLADRYSKGGIALAQFSSWHEMPFPTLRELFPGLRFFVIAWLERPAPGKEKQAMGLSGGECTLVWSPDTGILKEIFHSGNYDAFGALLAAKGVSIRSVEDAKLVWAAFCDIHQKHWRELAAVQVAPLVWHLGDNTIEGVHYYYEVILDNDKRVTAARLRSYDPKRPKSK